MSGGDRGRDQIGGGVETALFAEHRCGRPEPGQSDCQFAPFTGFPVFRGIGIGLCLGGPTRRIAREEASDGDLQVCCVDDIFRQSHALSAHGRGCCRVGILSEGGRFPDAFNIGTGCNHPIISADPFPGI